MVRDTRHRTPGQSATRFFNVQDAGRLLDCLLKTLSDKKRKQVKQCLKHGCVSVNGRVTTRHDHPLHPGDRVCVQTKRQPRAKKEFLRSLVDIVYEDEVLIVANKPAGLLSISTANGSDDTFYRRVNDYLNGDRDRKEKRVFVVHRLDREVSGLVVFAKTHEAKCHLQSHWHRFEKHYSAVVEGVPELKSGTLESYLRENKYLNVRSTREEEKGKLATTRYRVLGENANFAFLEIILETGRKHQIRVHLAEWGHPIAGDQRYGAKTNREGRVALHASWLKIRHPVSGKSLTFHRPAPFKL